jgi:hypothetical protein
MTTTTPTIAVVGSGPIGCAYARILLEEVPDARVILFEAGPQLTAVPGESVRNLPDSAAKERAREMSQGPQAGSFRKSLGIPESAVVEGMFTARGHAPARLRRRGVGARRHLPGRRGIDERRRHGRPLDLRDARARLQ